MTDAPSTGPLLGLRVIEFTSIGPGPHCAMLLSDMGAEVLRIDRPGGNGWPNPIVDRGRHIIELDIRSEAGRTVVMEAVNHADVILEGYRPGVMERLGFGAASATRTLTPTRRTRRDPFTVTANGAKRTERADEPLLINDNASDILTE